MSKRALVPIAAIVAVELAISAAVLAMGFVALSDDDFSRVLIAQRFVAHPSFDPSETSWLPLPFLILGTIMSMFGRSLAVARLVAVAEGAIALLLVHRAAKNLALSDRAALASAVLAGAIPTAARLDVSFQPEALTAGLVLFGASTLMEPGRARVLGGLALGAATLCRYEAWPAALVFAVFCAVDTVRAAPNRAALAGAGLATVPAISWMLHGAARHGSPVFFLHRVAGYRHALGEAEPLLASLSGYPAALVLAEPELALAAAVVLVLAWRNGAVRLGRFARPAALLAAVFLFLVAGRILGGAPTHHDERPLLPIFWALSMAVAGYVFEAPRRTLAVMLGAAACGSIIRFERTHESLAERAAELSMGEEAKRRVGAGDRLLVETGDYGYFAVIAAFGSPERAEPFDRHDPREAPAPDPFVSADALRGRLRAGGATWFVAPGDKTAAAEVGTAAAWTERLVLFHVRDALP